MPRLARLAGYISWSVIDQFVYWGVPRLVLFPILAALLGGSAFGSFIIALSFIQMVGAAPSVGLSGYILRDAAKYEDRHRQILMRSTVVFSFVAILPFSLFFVLGAKRIAAAYHESHLAPMLAILGIYLLLLNLTQTALTLYRMRRAFSSMALIHSVQTILLFLAVPGYWITGESGVALAYVLAAAGALVVLLFRERHTFFARPFVSRVFIRHALRVWLPLSASALIVLSASYLDRLALGYWFSGEEVAIFFVAASTANIFIIPGTLLSGLTLSMLGSVETRQRFSPKFYRLYAVGNCLFAVLTFVVGILSGNLILRVLYPSLMERALPLWNYAVGSCALMSIMVGCRPFVIKFLSPRVVPLLALGGFLGRVIPIFLLVPTGGRIGAVQAMLVGSIVAATLWFAVYLRAFVFRTGGNFFPIREDSSGLEAVNGVTEGSPLD